MKFCDKYYTKEEWSKFDEQERFEIVYEDSQYRHWLSENRIKIILPRDDSLFLFQELQQLSLALKDHHGLESPDICEIAHHFRCFAGRGHATIWLYEEECIKLMNMLLLYQKSNAVKHRKNFLTMLLGSKGFHEKISYRECKNKIEQINDIVGVAYLTWQRWMEGGSY